MKLTRHNGRAGKNGAYNPKHNDRSFDIENSEHIDAQLAQHNVYWDCYNGIRSPSFGKSEEEVSTTFEEVEQIFYEIHYRKYVEGQNARNMKNRHPERNRTTEEIRKHKKTCPEETVYQIGTMEEHIDPDELLIIVTEFMTELNERFGEHLHLLNWSLHLDESTPHIHERHVFDCENAYGEIFPQQEKALEALGFELPDPEKKAGRFNNRKMVFDAACRVLLFDICKKHGLQLEEEPSYGGRAYLEKQDYIRMKQKETIKEQAVIIKDQVKEISAGDERLTWQNRMVESNAHWIQEQGTFIKEQSERIEELTMKITDVEALIDEVAEIAYDKAVDVVTDEVILRTRREDISLVEDSKRWIQAPERKASRKEKDYALARLDGVISKIERAMSSAMDRIKERLRKPEVKRQAVEQIKQTAKPSIMNRLQKKKEDVAQREADRKLKMKKQNMEL